MTMNQKPFPERYVPTLFESYCQEFYKYEKPFKAHFCDTCQLYDRLYPLSYSHADIVLLCFALNNQESFQNLTKKYINYIKLYAPKATVFVVGTKFDLYQYDNPNCVSDEEVFQLVMDQKFDCYIQCSAKDGYKVDDIFLKLLAQLYKNSNRRTKLNVNFNEKLV